MSNSVIVVVEHYGMRHETGKAVLIDTDAGDIWIPRSLIDYLTDSEVHIPEWLAEERGLDYERYAC